VQESVADEWEVRATVGEGHDLTVEDPLGGQVAQLGEQCRHVPASTRSHPKVTVPADQGPEAVPLHLEGVVARRDLA
jgi:hypothetical protein